MSPGRGNNRLNVPPPEENKHGYRASDATHYEEFRHPNLMTEMSHNLVDHPGLQGDRRVFVNDQNDPRFYGSKKRDCAFYFRKFDD
mmetsp:Transcript_7908/g.13265  ORF Transcript_7908/g.13265 Transcript_7908/m.13265 type:complete len:86 (-) Transcript_7908:568-825(-)